MKKLGLLFLLLLFFGCDTNTDATVTGKWYTYAESGDYMELWIGEDRAMSYLSSVDEFLLYDLNREGKRLKFSLIESKLIDEHQFELEVIQTGDEMLKTIFISDTRIDSLKTYFLLSGDTPLLASTLEGNRQNMEELFIRLETSHAGHDH